MPPALIASLSLWADTQSLISRTTEAEVAFKAPFARKLLQVAGQLCRWYRHRSQSVKALALTVDSCDMVDCDDDVDNDGQVTETAGEDNSDHENIMDEDTDQDGPGDEEGDELGDDSDFEADPHPFVAGF